MARRVARRGEPREARRLDEARAGEVEEAEASGDAASLKSLATRLMRRVGASAGAPVQRSTRARRAMKRARRTLRTRPARTRTGAPRVRRGGCTTSRLS